MSSRTRKRKTPATRVLKSLGKTCGWFVLSRVIASLKENRDIETLYQRSELMGRLALALMGPRRKLLLSNICTAVPQASKADINMIAKEIVRNISRGFVDIFYHVYHPELMLGHVKLEENGVLEKVLAHRRGFIVATGHVGAFPWLGRPIVERGFPFAPIARDPHDERLKQVFDDARNRAGYINIPDRPPLTVIKESLKVLRKGGAVMITFDMYPGRRSSLEVDLLGRKTPMFSTVVKLAARTRVPIVPGHVLPEPDGVHHRVTYYPPIKVPPEAADDEHPLTRELLQNLADWLSEVIRSHPDQWWAIHRRWRKRGHSGSIHGEF